MLTPNGQHHAGYEEGVRHQHHRLLYQMQQLRGRIYLQDRAIRESQLEDGRHQMPADKDSWHLLIQTECGQIKGCVHARLHHPSTSPHQLAVSRAAIARDAQWRNSFKGALEAEMAVARGLDIPVLEVGGLAVDEQLRGSSAVLQMVFGIYGLARALGGAIGISTVTKRHQSSAILRKLGGQPLSHGGEEIPAYYDAQYGCEMEVLKFYSWVSSLRHEQRFATLQEELSGKIPSSLRHWKRPTPSAHPIAMDPPPPPDFQQLMSLDAAIRTI